MRKRSPFLSTRLRVSQRPFWRAAAWSSLIGQLMICVPIGMAAASSDQLQARGSAPAAPAPSPAQAAAPPVHVNRTVPKVTQPSAKPAFSPQPTDTEITNARVFGEPLMKIGRGTLPGENRALADAVIAYLDAHTSEQVLPFLGFLKRYPDTPWRASLLLNLGLVYRHTGYFTRALDVWEQTWQSTKTATDSAGRAIGDRALGELVELNARLGRFERLEALFAETKDRVVSGHATEQVTAAREGLWMMRNEPEKAFLCGPLAVDSLLAATRGGYVRDQKIRDARSTPRGTSLAQLQKLAADLNLPLQMVHRASGAPVLLPALVHWKAGHFAALIREADGRFLVRDPTFGDELWVTRSALDEEATGYMLVQPQTWPTGWRPVEQAEGEQVWGKGQTDGNDPNRTQDGDQRSPQCQLGPCVGMPQYSVHLMVVSLRLDDTPLRYKPPRGTPIAFSATYNQREANQPTVFTFSNLGPKWTFNWLSYIEDDPTNANAAVYLAVPGGGRDVFQGFNSSTQAYQPEPRENSVLVRTSSNPIRYERRFRGGSVDVFEQSDGAATYPRRVFLAQSRDPQGNSVNYTFDSQLRLVAATDALGQVTTLSYENPDDSRKITRVTDPFGRVASFDYDASGRLAHITDVIGLQSGFTYDGGDFIVALTTPYGKTFFFKGESGATRWIEVTDPVGGKERIEYQINSAVSATDPPSSVPANVGATNNYLNYRNTFYWDKRAMVLAPRDPTSAHRYHWLHTGGPLNQTSGTLESEQIALEGRVWYRYPGQASSITEGTSDRPSVIARVLDDGSTQAWRTEYNDQGNITKRTDPLGRETSYVYATNGIDLQEVRQTSAGGGDRLAAYADYTSQHNPQTFTDAAGQVTLTTYNLQGQPLTVTNAKNETTTYTYDSSGDGYLQSVTGPVVGATTSYTYDGYGRVRTTTNVDGYARTMDYDALDRMTNITFPDGTSEQRTYDRLDIAQVRDRLGRISHTYYDPVRRVVAVRDTLGRMLTQQWCACGSLDAFIDGNGQKTRWERDLQGRVTREIRADGLTATEYVYETGTSRVKAETDAKAQVKTYIYNTDDSVQNIAYTNAVIATPSVSYTYDPNYPRIVSMQDGTGTATYTYEPVGVLGAMQVATVDGPLSDDTITYEYDELGRIVTRAINGVANQTTFTYDSLGRLITETNPLGSFTYGYDGFTGRMASVAYPNGQTASYAYYGNAGDRRLQTIHHKYPGGATLSKFDYTYDAPGNLLSWRQQADGAAVNWIYRYDAADQLLTAVEWSTDSVPAVLKRFAYAYDGAGNRTTEQIDDAVTVSAYDALNRLMSQQPGGALRVAGTVSKPASVTIQGKPATVGTDNQFVGATPVSPGVNTFSVVAVDASGNIGTQSYQVNVAGAGRTFAYDANGNLISDGTRTFEWDARNQLVAVNVAGRRSEYTYNGSQQRVRIVESLNGVLQSDTRLLWCENRICEERSSAANNVVRRLFEYGEQAGSGTLFYAKDHLGSPQALTDGTGSVQARYTFDPYGRRTLATGTDISDTAFTSHRQSSSGVLLAQFRAYDPNLGRWLSEDPKGLQVSLDLYEYVDNRPVRLFDPYGLESVSTEKCGANTKDVEAAYAGICKQVRGNQECQKVLAKFGAQDCMTTDCTRGIKVVCCQDCGGCGANSVQHRGDAHVISLAPSGLMGGAACGGRNNKPWSTGPRHTLAHEMSHCAVGADPRGNQDPSWWHAEEIAVACRGPGPVAPD